MWKPWVGMAIALGLGSSPAAWSSSDVCTAAERAQALTLNELKSVPSWFDPKALGELPIALYMILQGSEEDIEAVEGSVEAFTSADKNCGTNVIVLNGLRKHYVNELRKKLERDYE